MATITANPEPYFGRVKLGIQFDDTGVLVATVQRRDADGPWVTIRSGAALDLVNGGVVINDYEAPFDIALTYRVTQVAPAGTETGTIETTLASAGHTWLKDPYYASRNMRLDEVTSLPALTFAARSGVFNILDRAAPVVVAAKRSTWTGTLTFTTATDRQRKLAIDLFGRGQVLLLATPYACSIGSVYVYAGEVVEERIGVVTDPTRRWTVPLTHVDRPEDLAYVPVGLVWQQVPPRFGTWGELRETRLTWGEVLEAIPS